MTIKNEEPSIDYTALLEDYKVSAIKNSDVDAVILSAAINNQLQFDSQDRAMKQIELTDHALLETKQKSITDVVAFYNDLIIWDFVGTQPMQSPLGMVYSLQFSYRKTKPNPAHEWTFNAHLDRYVPVGVFKYEPHKCKQISESEYAALVEEYDKNFHDDVPDAFVGKHIDLQVVKQAVEAKSISFDSDVDLATQMNGYIFDEMVKASTQKSEVLETNPDKLFIQIQSHIIEIAIATRRGGANSILITTPVHDIIKESSFFKANKSFDSTKSFSLAGELNDGVKVFHTTVHDAPSMLMAYKGANEIDSGMTFAPYVPMVIYEDDGTVVTDPDTFETVKVENPIPIKTVKSRFGICTFDDGDISTSANYITFVEFTEE